MMVRDEDASKLQPCLIQRAQHWRGLSGIHHISLIFSGDQPNVVIAEGADRRNIQYTH
jgi:hypothetical protein